MRRVDRQHRLRVVARRVDVSDELAIRVAETTDDIGNAAFRCTSPFDSPNVAAKRRRRRVPPIVPCTEMIPSNRRPSPREVDDVADGEVVDVETEVRGAFRRQQSVRVNAPVAAIA